MFTITFTWEFICFLSICAILSAIFIVLHWVRIILDGWYYNSKKVFIWCLVAMFLLVLGIVGVTVSVIKGGLL